MPSTPVESAFLKYASATTTRPRRSKSTPRSPAWSGPSPGRPPVLNRRPCDRLERRQSWRFTQSRPTRRYRALCGQFPTGCNEALAELELPSPRRRRNRPISRIGSVCEIRGGVGGSL